MVSLGVVRVGVVGCCWLWLGGCWLSESKVVDVAAVCVSVDVDVVYVGVVAVVVDASHVDVVVVVGSGCWVVASDCRGMDRVGRAGERRPPWDKYGRISVLRRHAGVSEMATGGGCTNRESTLRSRDGAQRCRLGPLILSPNTRKARWWSTKRAENWRST